MLLTHDELIRYSQQLNLLQVGVEGQCKLKKAKVLCIGAGGLGSSVLLHLAAAGVGTLGIVDDDSVELSNLHRQILYQTSHVGYEKVLIAKQQLSALNPTIKVNAYNERLILDNANSLIEPYDIIVDCSDNFATRFLINDICFYLKKPFVFASIHQFEGQCSLFENTSCLRCLYPSIPSFEYAPNCGESGVLGILPGLLGVIQASEVIKWILNLGTNLAGNLLSIDVLTMQFRTFKLTHNPECSLCVLRQPIELLTQGKTCHNLPIISFEELKQLNKEDIILLDVRSKEEHEKYNIGGLCIPLPELPQRLNELNQDKQIIVYCQSGGRSMQAVSLLVKENFRCASLQSIVASVMPAKAGIQKI